LAPANMRQGGCKAEQSTGRRPSTDETAAACRQATGARHSADKDAGKKASPNRTCRANSHT
jgi:hypothetical protein